MVTPSVRHPSLAQVIFPSASWLRDLLLVVGGVVFVALLAQIRIVLPFTPVPITGQTLGVILIGATYGVRLGFLTLATYVVVGLGGLPVFAGGAAGLARLFGPTGGYLVAFPLAAALMGWLVQRFGVDRHPLRMAGSMALCSILILGLGSTWLAIVLQTNMADALAKGAFPFIPGDLVKMTIAALLLPGAWRVVGRTDSREKGGSQE
jgi:biotin transport system substrate-specific component